MFNRKTYILGSLLQCLLIISVSQCDDGFVPPHIIFILADDLGWNDVGFHGSNQIPTPNIDALAYSGTILNRYYVCPVCTPSRSALMTGMHPVHIGMQHSVLYGAEPRGLPINLTLLPQHLNGLGYESHMVGKWHLGSYKKVYTPTFRGFRSHTGSWTGHHDYYDHTVVEHETWGLDMRRNMDVAYGLHGEYSTDVYTFEAQRIIRSHNKSKPLFLYVAHNAVHSANNYNPLPAPDSVVNRFGKIYDFHRRKFAAVLSKMDDSVGVIVSSLAEQKMLENCIIVFSTDNGGPAAGFNANAASNWPLRGVKNTLWEGGVRGAALIWSALFLQSSRISEQTMHIMDWLPTLYAAAGGDVEQLGQLDARNLWPALMGDAPSPRRQILHNIDPIDQVAALTVDDWKIITGSNYNGFWDGWYGPSGRNGNYNYNMLFYCPATLAISKVLPFPTQEHIMQLREAASINCSSIKKHCAPLRGACLFNIKEDPCELYNLAEEAPLKLYEMKTKLEELGATAVKPSNLPIDPNGQPEKWNYVYTNFGDYIEPGSPHAEIIFM